MFVRESNYNKLHFLLEQFALTSQIALKPEEINKCMEQSIDYDSVNSKIYSEQKKSEEYLNQFLGKAQ